MIDDVMEDVNELVQTPPRRRTRSQTTNSVPLKKRILNQQEEKSKRKKAKLQETKTKSPDVNEKQPAEAEMEVDCAIQRDVTKMRNFGLFGSK